MAADTAEIQDSWVFALQRVVKQDPGCVLYKHMWYVTLDNKELEESKNSPSSRLHGPHLACLTYDQLILVQANSSGGPDRNCRNPVEILISTIRMCGYHKERMFFEPGRGSGIGTGRLWINVHDESLAHNMNDTILSMMYVKQEEGAGYRNRSFSSGSNSSRSRSVRSHYNNPPPSIIGMKKSGFGASSKRLRCDSLPVTHFAGMNDPRFRTGSEGEHTLRTARCNSNRSHNGSFRTGSEGEHTLRNSRCNSNRSHNGSVSPGMRNRLWMMRRRNSFAHHRQHHHVTTSQALSFSGSLIASSASSSAEQINCDLSSLASGDGLSLDELAAANSPASGGFHLVQRNGSISRHAKRYIGNWTSPIREGLETPQHCCSCGSTYGQSRFLDAIGRFPISTEQAPPPPEVDPPPNPLDHNLNGESTNTFFHARAHSLDENSCHSTQNSSLSSSPHQCSLSNVDCESFSAASEQIQLEVAPFLDSNPSSPPKKQSPLILQPTPASSVNDLSSEVKSQEDNRYPHQKITPDPEPNTSSFLSKITSTLSHSRNSRSDAEYTPMSPASNEAKLTSDGYVPMRSYPLQSTPQDIWGRRRSTPDVSCRNSHLSPPLYDPNSTHSICSTCHRCVSTFGGKSQTSLASSKPPFCQNSHVGSNEKRNSTGSHPTDTTHLAPPIGDSLRISSSSSGEKSNQEDLDMRALQEEVSQMKNSLDESSKHSPADASSLSSYSTTGVDLSCDAIGYLPMSPINPVLPVFRKNVFNSILSVAESHKAIPMYPHQRKDRTFISQDKPSKSLRSRRPKSLSFRRSGSLSRKNQKHLVPDAPPASRASPPTNGSRSPGGDYVNIDYKKAREQQLSSGYLLNLAPSDGLSKTVGSGTDINTSDTEYTAMSFNGF